MVLWIVKDGSLECVRMVLWNIRNELWNIRNELFGIAEEKSKLGCGVLPK